MTRKDDREDRALNFMAREHSDPGDLVALLEQVEREVWADVAQQTQCYQQFIFGQERSREYEAGFRAGARTLEGWIKSQQQELG